MPQDGRGQNTSLTHFPTNPVSITGCRRGPGWPPGGSRCLSISELPSSAPPRSLLPLSNPRGPPPKHGFIKKVLNSKTPGREEMKEEGPRQARLRLPKWTGR